MTAEVKIKTLYQTYEFTLYSVKDLNELREVIFDRLYSLTREEQKNFTVYMEVAKK